MFVCIGTHMPFRYRNGEMEGQVMECSCVHFHICTLHWPEVYYHGGITINVALIRVAFMCGRHGGAPGDLWNLQVR